MFYVAASFFSLPLTSGAGAGAGTARTVAAGVAASNARWD